MRTNELFINKERVQKFLKEESIEDSENIVLELEQIIEKRLKYFAKEKRKLLNNEVYDEAISFEEVYSDYDISTLPIWIRENISNARVIGNSKQTVILPDNRKYQLNNKLNHLSGGEWTYFTNSVLNTAYKTSGEDSFAYKIRKIHPTPKPPQLMKRIIEFFTKENELVLDYFMGVGGSLLGAAACGRKAIGIDLNPIYIAAYQKAAMELDYPVFDTVEGDALELLADEAKMTRLLKNKEVSLVLIDPPYGNMMSREKTGADIKRYGNVATPFTEDERDLGNLELERFYDTLKESVKLSLKYVKKKGHVVVFIKDLQPSGKNNNLLHARIIEKLSEILELNYKGMIIWADQTSKLFPYGYPFSFVANQIHQYILIFRKEK